MIKCIGCYELLRKEIDFDNKRLMTYICPRYFPYATVIGGLLRPGKAIIKAVKDCPEQLGEHCILCGATDVVSYGQKEVFVWHP